MKRIDHKVLRVLFILSVAAAATRAQDAPPNQPAVARTQSNAVTVAKYDPNQEFSFDGGAFYEFTQKLAQQYGSNILEILDVRGEGIAGLRIPKMRLPDGYDWSKVLRTYNRISTEGNDFLGHWVFNPQNAYFHEGRLTPPGVLVFIPPKPPTGETGGIHVRAFSTRGLHEETLKGLRKVIEQEANQFENEIASGRFVRGLDRSLARGRLQIHEGTQLLVAVGGKGYIDLVASVIEAAMPVKLAR